jgi:hypothetical protein
MATLILEVDDAVLARAENEARRRGIDLKSELLARVQSISTTSTAEMQMDAVRRMEELSKKYPMVIEGGMPSREERNAR